MSNLPIITPEEKPQKKASSPSSDWKERKIERTAYYEKTWRNTPERFDNSQCSIHRNRFKRLTGLIEDLGDISQKKAVDLGCGSGEISLWLCKKGMQVDAVDIASIPLEKLRAVKPDNLNLLQDYVPFTKLDDDTYDLVICNDLIGDLHPNEYRMLISELARIVKSTGRVICSTPLDLNSEDPLDRFVQLIDTEFEVENESYANDSLYIHWLDFLAYPRRLARATSSPQERKIALDKRRGLSYGLFKVLSQPWLHFLWKATAWVVNPLSNLSRNSDSLRAGMEKISRFFRQESGITHAIFLTKRRSLLNTNSLETPHDIQPAKQKRTVWE
ncbi:MAG: class I SAM-dependent methyltransferase [Parachlamydiales bacterium]|jgi:2-polyprenyl-3-methyl-5-hydroxy-6-metoxy-1,4-benzoquinol methylase